MKRSRNDDERDGCSNGSNDREDDGLNSVRTLQTAVRLVVGSERKRSTERVSMPGLFELSRATLARSSAYLDTAAISIPSPFVILHLVQYSRLARPALAHSSHKVNTSQN